MSWTCRTCNKVFCRKRSDRTSVPKYCSWYCFAHQPHVTKPEPRQLKLCATCTQEFTPKHGRQLTCSADCQRVRRNAKEAARQANLRPVLPDHLCDWCDVTFSPRHARCRFCCERCRRNAYSENRRVILEKRVCSQCRRAFEPDHPSRKFCSPLCLGRHWWHRYAKVAT